MKILILANSDVGLYKFRKELIQELINPGSIIKGRSEEPHEVYISLPNGEYIPELKEMGCIFIDTPVDRRGMNPFRDLKLINRYSQIIKKINPNVVLTYTIKPNIYGGIVCRIRKIPYLSNITGLGTSLESKGWMSKIILQMYKQGVHSADTIFFQNENNKNIFEQKKLVNNNAVLIPGSGVNLEEHCFEEYPIEEKQIRFLFIGRIMKSKGIEEYLDCAEYIAGNNSEVVFNIIGPYDEEKYTERIEELDKRGIIHYLGKQEDVHSFMKESHAIVLPSYHEGLSNVLLEASASGRPVLASNIPGCQETFENGRSGLGFTPRSAKSLIEAVEKFISLSSKEKLEMGKAARKKVENEYDRKIVIRSYLDAIEKYK